MYKRFYRVKDTIDVPTSEHYLFARHIVIASLSVSSQRTRVLAECDREFYSPPDHFFYNSLWNCHQRLDAPPS
ncbi:hypothetical protein AX774_g2320 [Zancudomyces culisetae]|uniref:Uncharacterized protein n=1 Tax=Zancudomyces culisetae TaxID=1213189 RepID=A0A1R1PT96_ZANCU|nr:hypothetical protein AX774_g2320 [Zancudomyces culisetae]|eukprot:OMH84164.1 hypothetical protein AX774_g2320 [Zancudomyces culisetae]